MKKTISFIQTIPVATFTFGAVWLMTLMCGCESETRKLPDFHSGTMSSTTRVGRQGGIEIAADPFVEPQRTQQFFGINSTEEGIGIVFVRISNNTQNQTFIVEKKNFQVCFAGASSGQNAHTETIEHRSKEGETLEVIGAVGLSVGAIAAGSKVVSQATEVQRNFVSKELPDQTLAPGESMEGFIYYMPIPKRDSWSKGTTMKVDLTDTKKHESVSLRIPLS